MICRSLHNLDKTLRGGFGSFFHAEALPGALPIYQNSPQHAPYGLYPELISGSAFTAPRAHNQYSWVYRKRPAVSHEPRTWTALKTIGNFSAPKIHDPILPEQYRFNAVPNPPAESDFIDGFFTLAVQGSQGDGAAAGVFAFSKNSGRLFRNCDAEMLLIPQERRLRLTTELGAFVVEPLQMCLVPRGLIFRLEALEGPCRGYFLENFGSNFIIPELGPIGISSGLAHPRHFEAPQAAEAADGETPTELVCKFAGSLFSGPIESSPFDVVAWYGTLAPLRFDFRKFMPINAVAFDHPDPSIGCVLQSPTALPGVCNVDFVIFPPRWMVAENTFRPPWFHRNVASEFMGLVRGEYDSKSIRPGSAGFSPGCSSIHNSLLPHGPDAASVKSGLETDTGKQQRYENTLAFMFEANKIWKPTEFAIKEVKQSDYSNCWNGIPSRFRRTGDEEQKFPFYPDSQKINSAF